MFHFLFEVILFNVIYFPGGDKVELVIGDGSGCPISVLQCNQTLKVDTDYYIFVRAYTSSFYRNSGVIHFKTGRSTFFESVNNLYAIYRTIPLSEDFACVINAKVHM